MSLLPCTSHRPEPQKLLSVLVHVGPTLQRLLEAQSVPKSLSGRNIEAGMCWAASPRNHLGLGRSTKPILQWTATSYTCTSPST